MNPYKIAPTWLFNANGETRLFKTQEEVDRAWDEGWYGPRDPFRGVPLISEIEWKSKDDLIRACMEDPRYDGIHLVPRRPMSSLMKTVKEFEESDAFGK